MPKDATDIYCIYQYANLTHNYTMIRAWNSLPAHVDFTSLNTFNKFAESHAINTILYIFINMIFITS